MYGKIAGKEVREMHSERETVAAGRKLNCGILIFPGVAELADALDSKSSDRKVVMVRLHSPGPRFLPFYCYQLLPISPKT
jgi:hypothetical protein